MKRLSELFKKSGQEEGGEKRSPNKLQKKRSAPLTNLRADWDVERLPVIPAPEVRNSQDAEVSYEVRRSFEEPDPRYLDLPALTAPQDRQKRGPNKLRKKRPPPLATLGAKRDVEARPASPAREPTAGSPQDGEVTYVKVRRSFEEPDPRYLDLPAPTTKTANPQDAEKRVPNKLRKRRPAQPVVTPFTSDELSEGLPGRSVPPPAPRGPHHVKKPYHHNLREEGSQMPDHRQLDRSAPSPGRVQGDPAIGKVARNANQPELAQRVNPVAHDMFEQKQPTSSSDSGSINSLVLGNEIPSQQLPKTPHVGDGKRRGLVNRTPEPKKTVEQPTKSNKAISDLVRDSKLETVLVNNGGVVRHISYISNPRMRQRRMKREETWRRRKKLGSGSFGCVWLEERLDGDGIEGLRAVKEITKRRDQEKGSEIDYNRELEAIAKFSHTKYVHCFVQSFGWYESENTIFITMEYFEHGDLQSHLVRPLPEDEAKQITFQLLEGLKYMHENGFAHRDLKPANVLVSEPSPNWWVKISDFGISKRAEEEATAFRTFVGSRGYLAPEILGIYSTADMDSISSSQVLDDSSSIYTVSVDLWALGAITFRLLTNKTLFRDPRELAKYVTVGHPFPRAAMSELGATEACMDFLENIMARSPSSRPSSSEALRHKWLSELRDPVDIPDDLLEELSIAVEDSQTESTIADVSLASAQWPTSLG